MKLGLKLMASVCPNRMDAEREFLNHIINELNGILMIVTRVDFHCPDPGGIVNSCILKTSDSMTLKVPQRVVLRLRANLRKNEFLKEKVETLRKREIEKAREEIERRKDMISQLGSRKTGPDWKEANIALQQIMQDYAGPVRSETLLRAGMEYLRRLRKKVDGAMMAQNQWELTRCMETLNLFDLGELVMVAANERKESRGLHNRPDFPLTDPMLDGKGLFVKREQGAPVIEWKNIES